MDTERESPLRRADDIEREALRFRMDTLGELFNRHLQEWDEHKRAEREWQESAQVTLDEIREVLTTIAASRRIGVFLLGVAAAVGAFLSWALDFWKHIK